eukprot:183187_1
MISSPNAVHPGLPSTMQSTVASFPSSAAVRRFYSPLIFGGTIDSNSHMITTHESHFVCHRFLMIYVLSVFRCNPLLLFVSKLRWYIHAVKESLIVHGNQ